MRAALFASVTPDGGFVTHVDMKRSCCPLHHRTPVSVLRAELRTSLEEHQSALELIMTKYREQVFRLLMASKRDDPAIVTQLKEQHTTVSSAYVCLLIVVIFLIAEFQSIFPLPD